MRLNVNAVCDTCNAILVKGTQAAVGIVSGGGALPFRCQKCLEESDDDQHIPRGD